MTTTFTVDGETARDAYPLSSRSWKIIARNDDTLILKSVPTRDNVSGVRGMPRYVSTAVEMSAWKIERIRQDGRIDGRRLIAWPARSTRSKN